MTYTREDIYGALYTLGSTAQFQLPSDSAPRGFVTTSRRVKLFSDVDPKQQPAFFQAEHGEQFQQVSNLPYKRIFAANWIVYQNSPKANDTVGATINNIILDALQAALAPTPSDRGYPQRNTLNGMVYHCFIDGEGFKDPGDIDEQGMMVVPIKLLVP